MLWADHPFLWPSLKDHGKKYPKRKLRSTMILEGERVRLLHKYATHFISIHQNVFKIYHVESKLFPLFGAAHSQLSLESTLRIAQ